MTSTESKGLRLPLSRAHWVSRAQWISCVALGSLAIAYLALGFYTLVVDNSFSYPVDLRLRWIEQGMIRQGLNPQDLTYPEHLLPELIIEQRNVRGNYPPWSYATGLILAPAISWQAVRISFACINLLAIAGVAYWAFRQGEQLEKGWGLVTAVSVLATFPFCVCLSYGQYSIVVLAMLVACLELLRRDHMAAAGVALGIAAVKPQLAGLFFLVPLIFPFAFHKKLRFLLGAAMYLAVASCAIAWYVNSTPWEMLGGPANESVKFFRLSNNPLIIWSSDLFGFSLGSKLLAVFVAGICALLLFVVRRQHNLLAGFSICAILSMYWSYSRHYDLVLFAVPLTQLLLLWTIKHAKTAALGFLFLGILMWCPIRIQMSRWPLVELAYAVASVFALVTIVAQKHTFGLSLARFWIWTTKGFLQSSKNQ